MRSSSFPRVLLAALALRSAHRLTAQVFQGVALDDSSHTPIAGYPVKLLRRYSQFEALVGRTKTDAKGMFQIMAREPGVYRLEFGDSLTSIVYGPVDTVTADDVILRQYYVYPTIELRCHPRDGNPAMRSGQSASSSRRFWDSSLTL